MCKRNFLIFLLIILAGFLILPKISLAEDFKEITPETIRNYLELPEKDGKNLLSTLKRVFTTDWAYREGSGYSTDEERLVPLVLRKAVGIYVLNHLLIDAPIEVSWKIIENATKIARLFLAKDISVILEELEKESVQKAIDYGMRYLLQNEIRVTPGVIEFEYSLQKGGRGRALLQYVLIYQPLNEKQGKVIIKLYSPNPIEPPKSEGSFGGKRGTPHSLQENLPSFIVEIRGKVEKGKLNTYFWIDEQGRRFIEGPERVPIQPSVKIDFSQPVPDLGIKPLSFLERHLLKPIETTIKDIEIVITKVFGKSPKIAENVLKLPQIISNVWDKVKSTISQYNPFGAGVGPIVSSPLPAKPAEGEGTAEGEGAPARVPKPAAEPKAEKPKPPVVKPQPASERDELKKKELQRRIDELLKKIALTRAEIDRLTKEKERQKIAEETEEASEKLKEKEKQKKKDEDREEKPGQKLCERTAGIEPLRNKIIFNEIAWMGTEVSANDEWIELKNVSGRAIDLTGWQLLDKDKQIKKVISGGLSSANNFFLLERTNNETVPGIRADLIYQGALKNNNEVLFLFDENCRLQDFVEANPNWPAGDNVSKRTMERRTDLSWQASAKPGGTPRAENSKGYFTHTGGAGTGAGAAAPAPPLPPPPTAGKPQITLFYPPDNPVNKEIAVQLSVSNLKDATYDVKISIENQDKKILSEIYNPNESDWQSSFNYLRNTFPGTSFSGNFRLRIKEKESFRGEADIIVRIREKEIQARWQGKINITNPVLTSNPSPNPNPKTSFAPLEMPLLTGFAKNLVITEVLTRGKEEFVELYNPTDNEINMSGWYLSYFSSGKNWNKPSYNKLFPQSPTTTIPAKGYFLIGFGDYNDPKMDWKADGRNISDKNGAVGIFSCNPKIATTTEQAKSCKIDIVAWGNATTTAEGDPAGAAPAGKSLARKIAPNSEGILTYIDSDNNKQDFKIQNPTPKARNHHSYFDLDDDGIIDSSDPETIVSTNKTLEAGEYHFKKLIISEKVILTLNSSSSLVGFQGVKIVAENLTLATSSLISADGRGWTGGKGPGSGKTGEMASGGGYGGRGGNIHSLEGGKVYGSLFEPTDLGSGGGNVSSVGVFGQVLLPGGSGGGAIKIEVSQTLTINGTISANGLNGRSEKAGSSVGIFIYHSGGGSGGSIFITTNVLVGSGLIRANGGKGGYVDPVWGAGAGGGGRIAVYYQANNFNDNFQTYGGARNRAGGAGTIYLKSLSQTLGDLILDNNNLAGNVSELEGNEFTFNNLKILNSSHLYLPENLTANNISVENKAVLEATSPVFIQAKNFDISESSLIGPSLIFIKINVNNFKLQQKSKLIGNFEITAETLFLESDSIISADGKGYPAGQGLGAGKDAERASGAGYGGKGGDGVFQPQPGGLAYGSPEQPLDLGSGGGNASSSIMFFGLVFVPGGSGGGAIKIEISHTLTINGIISANGLNGRSERVCHSGGGSGGSIYITTNVLTGSGSIQANGGKGGFVDPDWEGGAGGGGRIAVYFAKQEFTGKPQALGGVNAKESPEKYRGGPGTIYLKPTNQEGELFSGEAITKYTPSGGL